MMHRFTKCLLIAVPAAAMLAGAASAPPIPVAGQVDPASLGQMVGAPPPADKQINLGNATDPQNLCWSMRNVQRLQPVARIWHCPPAAAARGQP